LSPGDEKSFFDRLQALRCVVSVVGAPDGLHVLLSKPPTDLQLRELIALLYRYDLDMRPLAALRTERNAAWFSDRKKAFWHSSVFRTSKSKKIKRPNIVMAD